VSRDLAKAIGVGSNSMFWAGSFIVTPKCRRKSCSITSSLLFESLLRMLNRRDNVT
jgi:hypothetical protein